MRKLSVLLLSFFLLSVLAVHVVEAAPQKQPRQLPLQKTVNGQYVISGKVMETMNSGGYTYARLESGGQSFWVACPQAKIEKGKDATFTVSNIMEDFESKSLKRKFDVVIFSSGAVDKKSASGEVKAQGSKANVVKDAGAIKVAKASGANSYTIAELYSKKSSLNNKPVVARGKVVKVSAGIMMTNWIHIQDGTGDSAKGTNNLVVTSDDLPAVDTTVTVKGTLYMNKDFGGGYKYDVIVQNASVKP